MGFTDDVVKVASDYLDGDYDVKETQVVPEPKDIPHGKHARKLRAITFCIDLRDSTGLLEVHQKQTAGKIHKAYLYACAKAVQAYGGYIRNFRGDGLIALWPGTADGASKAVRAAMVLKGLLDVKLKAAFGAYRELDFGIGLDVGDLFIVRAGLSNDVNNNDLVFIGTAINYAVAVAEQAHGPSHVEICPEVYKLLGDDDIYGKDSTGATVNMWHDGTVQWRDESYASKLTTWYRTMN